MEDFDYFNTPISVTDASSMLRRRVQKNELPYTTTVIKLNNRLVDEWEKKILRKMEDRRGTVPSGKVWPSWQLFKEGKEIQQYAKIRHMIPRPSEDQLEFWIDFFEKASLEDLHKLGSGTLSFAWSIIEQEIRLWNTDKKWEDLFSKSDDPIEWEKMAPSHQNLLKGELFPFWDRQKVRNIGEKVGTILALQIEPKAFRRKVTYNMRPYTKVVAKLNNNLVSRWEQETMGEVTDREKLEEDEFNRWMLWYENEGLQSYRALKDKFPKPTQEQLDFWKSLLEESLEKLHSYGTGVSYLANQIIQTTIRMHIADLKLEKIYTKGSTFEDWQKIAEKEKDLVSGNILPFWDENTLRKVMMKIGTVMTIQVTPEN